MSWKWFEKFQELKAKNIPFALCTLTGTTGSVPREVGAKMIVVIDHDHPRVHGTIGGGHLEFQTMNDAVKAIRSFQSGIFHYKLDASVGQACGGNADVFIEVIAPGHKLYLFGAGHVGQALCRVMQGTPFDIHLVDERDEWVNATSLPSEVHRHGMMWNSFTDQASWSSENVFVAIMTHDHLHDLDILKDVLKRETTFIGLMGSSNKWKTFQQDLKTSGFSEEQIARVHCPIGEKELGPGPTEIAIGIAREMLHSSARSNS
jgi:xanthine dehydrogenase accessory factor